MKKEEKSIFVQVFGDAPLIKVLDFFLCEGLYFDYSLTDIAKYSGVSWRTLHFIIPKLLKLGVIEETRQIGRAKLYKLDKENVISKRLLETEFKLASDFADKTIAEQLKTHKMALKV